jgi:chromosome segregation ATPase
MQKLREASNDTYPATLQAHEAQVASYQKQHAGIEKQQDEQQRRLQEVGASAQGCQEELSRLQEQVKAKKRAALQAQRNVRRQKEALEAAQEEQAALQEASREVDADFMRSTQEQAAGHRQRVAQCRGNCERAGVAVSNARQYRSEREAAAALERATVLEAERQLADANRRVHELEKDLRRLQASQGGFRVGLHRDMWHSLGVGGSREVQAAMTLRLAGPVAAHSLEGCGAAACTCCPCSRCCLLSAPGCVSSPEMFIPC